MQTERTFIDELKYQYNHGGMHIRLIILNTIIFLLISIPRVIETLSGNEGGAISQLLTDIFTLETDLGRFLYKPWGLVTSIFSHFSLVHFLMNMLFLFVSGRMFLQFFSPRRLLNVYIVGGITGGIFEILAHLAFPVLDSYVVVVGASGSIMAIFMALAFYRPNLQIALFGVIKMPFMVLAGFFLLSDLIGLGSKDGTAHFAHIGGALVGVLSVLNLHSSSNIINVSERFGVKMKSFFYNLFHPGQKLRMEKGGGRVPKTDEEYNLEAKERQKKIDAILDKISKSGYESLSKAEKEFLFSQSK